MEPARAKSKSLEARSRASGGSDETSLGCEAADSDVPFVVVEAMKSEVLDDERHNRKVN